MYYLWIILRNMRSTPTLHQKFYLFDIQGKKGTQKKAPIFHQNDLWIEEQLIQQKKKQVGAVWVKLQINEYGFLGKKCLKG